MNFPGGSVGKESACSAGDAGLIPGLGRSPGGRHGNSLQYSCLENCIDKSLVSCSPRGCKASDTTEVTEHARMHNIGQEVEVELKSLGSLPVGGVWAQPLRTVLAGHHAGLASALPASCSLFSDGIVGRHRILAIICEVKWKFSCSVRVVAIPFSRASSWLKDWTQVSCIAGRFFTFWVTRELAHIGERSGGGKSSHLMTQNNFYLCLCVSGTFIYLFCSYLSVLRPTGKLGTLYDWNVHEIRSPWEPFSYVCAAFTWHSQEGVFNFQTVASSNGQVWDGDSYTTWNI